MAISQLKISQTNVFLLRKSKHECGEGLRGHVYRSLTFPRWRSHRSYYRNLTFQNIPMAVNTLLNKCISWKGFLFAGRLTDPAIACFFLKFQQQNRNIVVCQGRWAGNSFSNAQASLSLEFSHPSTEWRVEIGNLEGFRSHQPNTFSELSFFNILLYKFKIFSCQNVSFLNINHSKSENKTIPL